ncbi:MAG TPA: DUF5343 domain-containing protein [Planctomycetota bacterium]|nr:DUF5343 domain-containing protein [Planctomycetota bacterium]
MADFPYTLSPGNVKRFFGQLQEVGKPDKVPMKWIEALGFKSKNDRYLLTIMKSLGFVDNGGVPTERWGAYRNKETAPAVMAVAVREAYRALFATYPEAHQKDTEALRNFFSTHSSVGARVVSLMVNTFKALVELADFDAAEPAADKVTEGKGVVRVPPAPGSSKQSTGGLVVNLNIQLQLPATDDAAIYEKLFEAMKKHLLS